MDVRRGTGWVGLALGVALAIVAIISSEAGAVATFFARGAVGPEREDVLANEAGQLLAMRPREDNFALDAERLDALHRELRPVVRDVDGQ